MKNDTTDNDEGMAELLVVATCGDGLGALVNPGDGAFRVLPTPALKSGHARKEQTRFRWLLRNHEELLKSLLAKSTLAFYWEPNGPVAHVSIIPVENNDAAKPFETFTLPFAEEVAS